MTCSGMTCSHGVALEVWCPSCYPLTTVTTGDRDVLAKRCTCHDTCPVHGVILQD